MSTKHTPSPWFVTYGASGAVYVASKAGSIGYQTIVEMHSKPATEARDARLIAAAPELLAAVKTMLTYIETYGGDVTLNFSSGGNLEHYKQLLAKAEGGDQ